MKSYQIFVIAAVLACASAFAPATPKQVAFKPLAASNLPEPVRDERTSKAAAMAAFATAIAPIAAHAETVVDEATVIGYGAGLVACVVSLAVGFAIGYGTLVKP